MRDSGLDVEMMDFFRLFRNRPMVSSPVAALHHSWTSATSGKTFLFARPLQARGRRRSPTSPTPSAATGAHDGSGLFLDKATKSWA
ncbi:hypothetical protein EVAR_75207_1 [Eumeta japonica]|uniref:Uncharacterized protein n=1 Tax=Eumeta variegata TaxID=151549 RepID=A0A4C1U1I0_EUMVA|nr:hypothetical protein EVAR_75207_1 [Eumeta japonica]